MSDLPRDFRQALAERAEVARARARAGHALPGRQREARVPTSRRRPHPVRAHARRGPPHALPLHPGGLRLRLHLLLHGHHGARPQPHRRGDRRPAAGRRPGRSPGQRVTHVVFMGMGEPLANYAATVQVPPHPHRRRAASAFRRGGSPSPRWGWWPASSGSAEEDLRVNLAISLHATTDEIARPAHAGQPGVEPRGAAGGPAALPAGPRASASPSSTSCSTASTTRPRTPSAAPGS